MIQATSLLRILAAVIILGSAFGCSLRSTSPVEPSPPLPTSVADSRPLVPATPTPLPRPVSVRPTPSSPKAASAEPIPCLDELTAPWRAAMEEGRIPTSLEEGLVAIGVDEDASRLVAALYTADSRGLVLVDRQTGERTPIKTFAGPDDQAYRAGFDGRWLVWAELHSRTTFSNWSLHAWDALEDRLIEIARAPRQGDQVVLGPLVYPDVANGKVTWTQVALDGQREVHLYDLLSGTDQVIARGKVEGPVFVWPFVVWPEGATTDTGTRLAFASAETGERTATPAALDHVRTPTYLDGTPGGLIWVETNRRSLWLWRAGDAEATPLLTVLSGDHIEWPQIGSHLIGWRNTEASFVLDLRSGATAQVTPQWGGVELQGRCLVISYPATDVKQSPMPQEVFLMDIGELPPLPPCP